jgi:acetyl esterase/lipase
MKYRRIVKWGLLGLLALVVIVGALAGSLWWYFHPAFDRQNGFVYTQRHGHDLTFDVVYPKKPSGQAIILMVSGGWRSHPDDFHPWMVAPLLRRHYTVFAVSHLSQPEATVMEIVEDVNRAVRFIRYNAPRFGIERERIGVTGGSAGGHLSLMLATCGGPGPIDTGDPVDRFSSSVQAVAIFYPVTDLLNLGASTENPGDGGPPKSFVEAFGPDSTDPARWQEIGRAMSPIYHVTAEMPPTLIYHGDADTLVPLDQSERFAARAREAGANVKLVVHRGGMHGWITMFWDIRQFADWFDQHLE